MFEIILVVSYGISHEYTAKFFLETTKEDWRDDIYSVCQQWTNGVVTSIEQL